MIKKIVIVSSGQPSANPRAVKEAILFSENAYDVTFIYCPISNWANDFDKELFSNNPSINFISCVSKCSYFEKYARIRRKFWSFINPIFKNKFDANLKSIVLYAQELDNLACTIKADLYIGHNLGAIKAIVNAAKKHNVRAVFDAEDFHSGEGVPGSKINSTTFQIEQKYFPQLSYCTVASPLIGSEYKKIFPSQKFIVINNVFSKKYSINLKHNTNNKTLSLFWFSQFIGPNRGIEVVIDALNICKNKNVELHLLGNISQEYKNFILNSFENKNNIHFINPTNPNEIFQIASNFDIGLATEIPYSLNRNICLTNKVFTYLTSGNAIIFSNTQAQKSFLEENDGIGLLFEFDNPKSLSEKINYLYEDRNMLQSMKEKSKGLSYGKFSWEMESEKLLKLVKNNFQLN